MLQRYLLLWLTLLCGIALTWPDWGPGFDPFAVTKPYLGWMISTTMFAIGCLLPRDEIAQVLRRWPTVLGGTAVQYITMPLIAWGIGSLAGLPKDWMLGVILVGCVPGAMASNVLTLAARGNVSYSVSLTTSATLLSPVVVPFVLYLTLKQTDVDALGIARQAFQVLLFQVLLPVVAGHLLARSVPAIERWTIRWASVIANLVILWIIAVVVNANHQNLTQALNVDHLKLVWVLLGINLVGYAAGLAGGRSMNLPEGHRRALVLEVGMQNAGLGTTLATQLFPNSASVALPAALYTFGCMLTGTMLAHFWSRRELAVALTLEPVAPVEPAN
jgi:BASS family bile acid:Na+ symporter